MEWISVKDRLPSANRVLVHALLPYAAWYEEGRFYLSLGAKIKDDELKFVTHWMPLPEPPNT